MTVQYSRVQRRVDLARMKKRASKMWRFTFDNGNISEEDYRIVVCKLANNMQVCSCYACGNPRRQAWNTKERITMQEKRYLNKYRYELLEIYYGNEHD